MSSRTQLHALAPLAVLVLLAAAAPLLAGAQPASPDPAADACANPSADGACHNVPKALRLKLIAIPTILVSSVIGVCLPLFSRYVPALRPDRNLFVIVKAFASGVILATGYMHVLPDSFNNLTSPCLPKKPWGDFSFTAFVAMLAALFTLMVDSLMLTFYNRKRSGNTSGRRAGAAVADHESPAHGHWHGHGDIVAAESAAVAKPEDDDEASKVQLRRNRVVVQVTVLPSRHSGSRHLLALLAAGDWPCSSYKIRETQLSNQLLRVRAVPGYESQGLSPYVRSQLDYVVTKSSRFFLLLFAR
jgi:solute carrier family 39 (zinc transporter), member 1/2/3